MKRRQTHTDRHMDTQKWLDSDGETSGPHKLAVFRIELNREAGLSDTAGLGGGAIIQLSREAGLSDTAGQGGGAVIQLSREAGLRYTAGHRRQV